MKLENLNPFIRYAKIHETYYAKPENSVCYDCRIFYVLQGKGSFVANGKHYTVNRGDIYFLPPKTQYRFAFSNPQKIKIYVFNFDLTDEFCYYDNSLGTATQSTFDPSKTPSYDLPKEFSEVIMQPNAVNLKNYLDECVTAFLQKTTYFKHYSSANLKLALVKLLLENDNENPELSLVRAIESYIRNHYNDAELNNETIAEEFNYHPYHLNRLMKKHSGVTMHNFLIAYRVDMAKNFLTTSHFNITMIAEKTGFPSYTHFIESFKKIVGFTPLQYRKQHKNIGF